MWCWNVLFGLLTSVIALLGVLCAIGALSSGLSAAEEFGVCVAFCALMQIWVSTTWNMMLNDHLAAKIEGLEKMIKELSGGNKQ